ncbi:MAG TPA: hypothetical protein VD994_10040 [Prosthecobacter sp.]|nr:hypothetical protein [Prosthecobacter sp.]
MKHQEVTIAPPKGFAEELERLLRKPPPKCEGFTRREIEKATGWTEVTASRHIRDLVGRGVLRAFKEPRQDLFGVTRSTCVYALAK